MVAMSGGLDSTAAAILLMEQGCTVEGATFGLFAGNDAVMRAAEVCAALGIKHHVLPLEAAFEEQVVGRFASAYRQGVTPNPCVMCNKAIKFGAFYDWAMAQGADAIATGHYARVSDVAGRMRLLRAKDDKKDQSYVLYTMEASKIAHLRFPLCDLDKDAVRAIVAERGIAIRGGESQDICFIADGDYGAFLEGIGVTGLPGDFVDAGGRVLGKHRGIIHYTVGQRKGLGLAVPEPVYVSNIDAALNRVYLSDNRSLFRRGLVADEVHIIYPDDLARPRRVTARIRYNHRGATATAEIIADGRLSVVFDEPQRAITPGQSVVLYDGDILLGGGVIAYATD